MKLLEYHCRRCRKLHRVLVKKKISFMVEELLHNGEVKEDDKITLVLRGMRKKVLKVYSALSGL